MSASTIAADQSLPTRPPRTGVTVERATCRTRPLRQQEPRRGSRLLSRTFGWDTSSCRGGRLRMRVRPKSSTRWRAPPSVPVNGSRLMAIDPTCGGPSAPRQVLIDQHDIVRLDRGLIRGPRPRDDVPPDGEGRVVIRVGGPNRGCRVAIDRVAKFSGDVGAGPLGLYSGYEDSGLDSRRDFQEGRTTGPARSAVAERSIQCGAQGVHRAAHPPTR